MQAFGMTKIERRNKKSGILTVLLLLLITLFVGSVILSHAEDKDSKSAGTRTIVIDPGHGGHDTGVQGPDGSIEKELSLNFAQILAKELKPDYEVVFTRNGDYQVALTRRASVANHHGADMFISIHTGGGYQYQMNTWSVFYYQKTDLRLGENRLKAVAPDNNEDSRLNWNHVQLRHQKQSRALAGCMKNQLAGNPEIREVALTGAVLRVLEGLDMPAIIIETGYLTNPKTEKRLKDIAFLTDVAKSIKMGVDIYLTR